MKHFTFISILFFAASFTCIAQDYQDVVYINYSSIVSEKPNDADVTQSPVRSTQSGNQNAAASRYARQNNMKFGLKAGLNIANVAINGIESKAGLNGGIFGEFTFNNFAFQPELLYSMQGAKTKTVDIAGVLSASAKLNLNYLNIPLMLKYYVIDGLAVEIGPQLGVLLSAKADPSLGILSAKFDIKKHLNDFDFSMNFGASYQLPNQPLGVFARYSLGLTDIAAVKITDSSNKAILELNSGKNQVFQVGAFISF